MNKIFGQNLSHRNFLPSESRENHFSPISIHSEFPDLPIRFWRIGKNIFAGFYEIYYIYESEVEILIY